MADLAAGAGPLTQACGVRRLEIVRALPDGPRLDLAAVDLGLLAMVAERGQRRADALSGVTGSQAGRPILLLLNGLPASGKSTAAKAWAAHRPGALVLEIDLVRTLVSGDEAASQARSLAHAMAESHLLSGYDVVVPQLTARISNLVPFEEIATRAHAAIVHVLLDADSGTLHRRVMSDDARHRDGLDEQQLTAYTTGLQEVARTRDATRINTAQLTTDEVVAELERLCG